MDDAPGERVDWYNLTSKLYFKLRARGHSHRVAMARTIRIEQSRLQVLVPSNEDGLSETTRWRNGTGFTYRHDALVGARVVPIYFGGTNRHVALPERRLLSPRQLHRGLGQKWVCG